MERDLIQKQIDTLREKQAVIDAAWQKTGNRPLLEFIVEVLPRALDAQRAAIFIHDPERKDMWIQCGTGLKEMQVRVPVQGSVVGEVAARGECIIRHNMDATAGAHTWTDQRTGFITRDVLAVPIKAVTVSGVAGVIEVLNKNKGVFNEADRLLMEKAAFHVQMHIDNMFVKQEWARISDKMSTKIRELEKRIIELNLSKKRATGQ